MDELSDDSAAFGLIIYLYAIYRALCPTPTCGGRKACPNCYQDAEYILKVSLAKKLIDLKMYLKLQINLKY